MKRKAILLSTTLLALLMLVLTIRVFERNIDIWIVDYMTKGRQQIPSEGVIDIMFMVADHYEPAGNQKTLDFFLEGFRAIAAKHKDADGQSPKHTWFYPIEQFRGYEVDSLVGLARDGLGEVEVHLHHANDTDSSLTRALTSGLDSLRQHHALVCTTATPYFGFVHGNWALDNSRCEDGQNYCGVNSEIAILEKLGCYGDFTFPALFQTAQPSYVSSIDFITDDTALPKSYEVNHEPATVGRVSKEDQMMLLQGPLWINWQDWRFHYHPTIDDASITSELKPSPHRAEGWIQNSPSVIGNPSWRFIKVHTHGGHYTDAVAFVGAEMDSTLTYLETRYNDGIKYRLHYVTARESFNIVRAAEDGATGNPNKFRNYLLPPYEYKNVISKRGNLK